MKANSLASKLFAVLLAFIMVIGMLPSGIMASYADDELVKEDKIIFSGKPGTYYKTASITMKNAAVVTQYPAEINKYVNNSSGAQEYEVILDPRTPLDDTFEIEVAGEGRTASYVFSSKGAGTYQLEAGFVTVPVEMTLSRNGNVQSSYTRKFNINVSVKGTTKYQVQLPQSEMYEVIPESGSTEVDRLDSYKFTLDIKDGYKKNGTKFAVKANGTTLTPDGNGVYTIENILENQEVEVEGVIPADQIVTYTVALPSGTGYKVTPIDGSVSPAVEGTDYKFKLDIEDNYKKGTSFAVKDNGTTITGENDIYTIPNIDNDHTITVTGVEPIMYRVTLPTGEGYAATVQSGSTSPTQQGTSYSFIVRVKQGYKKGENFAVKANGETISPARPNGDIYTFTDIREDKVVTIEGIEEDTGSQGNTIPINFATDAGTIDSVTITDSNNCLLDGATYDLAETSTDQYTLTVKLPNSFDPKATVKAVFARTPDSEGYPYLTPKDGVWAGTSGSQTYGARTDTYSATLSNGSATSTAYVYHGNSRANASKKGTITIKYEIDNKSPKRIDSVPATKDEEITAGDTYSLDLSTIFEDEDGEPLTYKVKVNNAAAVSANENYSFTTDQMGEYTLEFTASDGKVESTDTYKVNLTVNRKAGTYYITLASGTGYSTAAVPGYSSPVNEGESFKLQLNITDGYRKSADFAIKANDTALSEDVSGLYTIENITEDQVVTVEGIAEAKPVIIAPAGSVITAGRQLDYFRYDWYAPVSVDILPDGRVQNTYDVNTGGNTFIRIQNPNGVTYWDFINGLPRGFEREVTESELHKGDPTFNKDTIYQNFEYNNLDLADIYMNINERGYLSLSSGEEKELNVFRNWYPIENFTNGQVALPDAHFEVVDVNGNPSDLVSIQQDQYNPCLATLTPSGVSGMAIVKVTYDALIHMDGMASSWGAGGKDPTRFSRIWPECTGVFVVTVDQDGSGINMGMTINETNHAPKEAGDKLDAEHDILYYFMDEGAEYTFSPEEGSEVSIARSTVSNNSLTYNGFTTEGVKTEEDGKVTVTGLTAGRNIVKVEKDGVANYQVITARHVKLDANDNGGNEIDIKSKIFDPGDKLTITLTNVNSPQEKFSGCYNNSFSIACYGEDDLTTKLPVSYGAEHSYGQYDFSKGIHTVSITIPDNWEKATYSIVNGAVTMGGFSGTKSGGHRNVRYLVGGSMAHGDGGQGVLGKFMELPIKVQQPPVRKEGVDAETEEDLSGGTPYSVDLSTIFEDPNDDTLTYKVSIDGAEPVAADEAYSFTPSNAETTLVFTANDGKADSKDTYTVKVTAESHTHDWGAPTYDWNEDNTKVTAKRVCTADSSHVEEETVDASSKVTKEATCDAKGETTYTSSAFQNEAFEVQEKTLDNIDALGHEWDTPTYEWNAANSRVVATAVCKRDETHKQTETKYTSKTVDKEVTATEDGQVTYTAKFTKEPFTEQTKIVTVPAYGSEKVRVDIMGQGENNLLMRVDGKLAVLSNVEVDSENTKKYGYEKMESVLGKATAFDALIALHKELYGDAFEADPKAYVDIDRYGTVKKIFGKATEDLMFHVNDAFPCYPDQPGLGSTIGDTPLKDNDDLRFFCTETDYYGMDISYLIMDSKEYQIHEGDEFKPIVKFKAAMAEMSGMPPWEWEYAEDAVVAVKDKDDKIVKTAVCNEQGEPDLSGIPAGDYYVVVSEFEDPEYYGTSFSTPYATLKVTAHEWGTPEYTWSDDNKSVTAERTCSVRGCKETETADAAGEITKPATCETKGETTYTSEAFKNAAFKVQTKTVEDVDALGHNWGEWKTGRESSCVERGQRVRVCRNDPDHLEFEDIALLDHELEHHEKKDATCTEAGNIEYWTCSKCGGFFSDADGKTKISESETIEDVEPLDHDWSAWKTGREATCTSKGQRVRACRNDPDHVEIEEIDMIDHKLEHHEAKDASCTDKGNVEYWTCTSCEGYFSDAKGKDRITEADTVIDALGHDLGDWKEVTPATCTEKGSEERSCSRCDHKEDRETEPLGHAFEEPEYKWNEDNTKVTATRTCKNDPSHIESETVDASSEITKDPACDEKGETTYTSAEFENETFDVQKKTVADIDATGHEYSEPDYIWSDDNKEVTAIRVCEHDYSHVDSETVKADAEVTKAPACEEMGETTYKATFENEAFEPQEKTVKDVDALGHDYGDELVVDKEPSCTAPGSKSAHCARCDATKYETEIPATGHDYGDWKVVKEATSSEEGEEQRVCANDPSHVEKRVIPKKTEPSNDGGNKAEDATPSDSKADGQKASADNNAAPASSGSADPDSKTPSDENLKNAKVNKKLNIKMDTVFTTARPSRKQMIVKWKKVKNATNYKISYRKAGAKKWTQKWTKGKNRITLRKMKKNGLYEFRLMAVRKSGSAWTKSKWSKVSYRFYAKVKQSVKPGKKSVTASVTKLKKASGYEVLTGATKRFKDMDVNAFKGADKTKLKVTGLGSKTNAFVRSRPYKMYKGHKYIGILNAVKKVKVK